LMRYEPNDYDNEGRLRQHIEWCQKKLKLGGGMIVVYHIAVEVLFVCNPKMIPIAWKRPAPSCACMHACNEQGNQLVVMTNHLD
jgi:hypothetical protein